MKLNLLVLKTQLPELLKAQYAELGFVFEQHRHGKGPLHYAAENAGFVLEIYPLPAAVSKADDTLRLGFEVENLSKLIGELSHTQWNILSPPKQSEWGLRAVIQDRDGRKVELTEKTYA